MPFVLMGLLAVCMTAATALAQDEKTPDQPPAAPSGLELSARAGQAKVAWGRVERAASYDVQRGAKADGPFSSVGVVKATDADPTFLDPTVEAGQAYHYRVLATDAQDRTSKPSEAVELRILRAPTEAAATLSVVKAETRTRKATVTWKDGDPDHTEEFRIDRKPAGAPDSAWAAVKTVRKGKSTFEDEEGLDWELTYTYRVVALKGSSESLASNVARTPALAAPAPARGLTAGAFSPTAIALRWRAGSANAAGYRIERRKPGGTEWSALGETGPAVRSYVDTVKAGQAFEYRVVAWNEHSVATGSAPVGARTPTRAPGPLGAVGPSWVHKGPTAVLDTNPARPKVLNQHFSSLPDRWRIEFPEWNRTGADTPESPYNRSEGILDPYKQNVLKGDYPIFGNDIFMILEVQSDNLAEARSFPFPSGVSTANPRQQEFFGEFDQGLFTSNFLVSFEVFQGDTNAFRPKDFAFKMTTVANANYLLSHENNLVNIDPREGNDRLDGHIGIQELLIDKHIVDLSPNYDFITFIGGIQKFQSDFRGFVYADNNLGARLQANAFSNRVQANVVGFQQLEKETNSGLNRLKFRDQYIVIANLFVQDALKEVGKAVTGHDVLGYTILFNYHLNIDRSTAHYDQNDFLVRPAKIGAAGGAVGVLNDKELDVHYFGFGGDGHIGPVNISHQYYMAMGKSSFNEIAGKKQDILAHFAAIELSMDFDWLRVKASYLYSSGDRDPSNKQARGFSSILDNPFFAGSGFSYFNRQNVPLVQTGVQLVQRLSLLPDLRSSKIEGQSNFVNPGLHLFNVGLSARLTPKLFVDFNVNFMWFDHTEVLEYVLVQSKIDHRIGVDYSIGFQYRPLLTDNVILTAGASALVPGGGFRDIYNARTLYSGFLAFTLTY